jgi:inorganic pyrophosphatase
MPISYFLRSASGTSFPEQTIRFFLVKNNIEVVNRHIIIHEKQKYELDKQTGMLRLDRILYTSTHYPANYGFIPRTLSGDGDPLDVLILCSESLIPLSLVECTPIGVITMNDNGFVDEKIIAVPFTDPYYNNVKTIYDLQPHVFEEMRHFFSVYKTLEHKDTVVDEIGSREEAMEIIANCIENYKINHYKLVSPLSQHN